MLMLMSIAIVFLGNPSTGCRFHIQYSINNAIEIGESEHASEIVLPGIPQYIVEHGLLFGIYPG